MSDDDIALVHGLVEIPSLSRREGDAVVWLVGRMAERGFRATVDHAGNAVGEIGSGPRTLVLLGHIDTVSGAIPVRIDDGDLVGRGAVDAKGPLAAFVAAASDPPPGIRVTVVGAVEEESPTSAGARYRATLGAPDWCVIGEPSGWDGVTVGYKGRLMLRVALARSSRHGAAPGPTVSEVALELWGRIQAAASERAGAGSERLDCRLEGMAGGPGDGLEEKAELVVGYRLPPGLATDVLEAEVRRIAAGAGEGAAVRVTHIAAEEPVRTARTNPVAQAFARAIARAGGRVTFKVKSGTSDMNVLAPAWRCPMVAYGPGDSSYDHTPMERLSLEEYRRSIAILKDVITALAGLP